MIEGNASTEPESADGRYKRPDVDAFTVSVGVGAAREALGKSATYVTRKEGDR